MLSEKLRQITTFVFDVDGVLTDGVLTVTKDDVLRNFSVRDGYAIDMAVKNGYNIAIITGGKQESIVIRMNSLGVNDVFIRVGSADKPKVMENYLSRKRISAEEVLYVGDDIPDLLLMRKFDLLACCPKDAVEEVKAEVQIITEAVGGRGVAREVIEMVMKAQGKWMGIF